VKSEPPSTFPALLHGHLTLQALPVSGKRVRGDFTVTFVVGTDRFDGRTAFKSFEAQVQ
jgi:hypothetical protein